MNKHHHRRLYFIIIFMIGLALAASLVFYALKQNMNAFYTPSQALEAKLKSDYHFRLGGMVKQGSVVRDSKTLRVEFIVTDLKSDLPVRYVGVLPDLFREGKGVIAEGSLDSSGLFTATQILAKHDENYMPKNIATAIQKNQS